MKFFFAETIKQTGPGFTLITMFHLFSGEFVGIVKKLERRLDLIGRVEYSPPRARVLIGCGISLAAAAVVDQDHKPQYLCSRLNQLQSLNKITNVG